MYAVMFERSTVSADGSQSSSAAVRGGGRIAHGETSITASSGGLPVGAACGLRRRLGIGRAPEVGVERADELEREVVGALERLRVDVSGTSVGRW